MSSACSSGGDRFLTGEWKLEGWMEDEGAVQRIEPQTHTVKVSEQLASRDPRTVAFTEFYRGADASNVIFADGEISGHINQGAVAPFPEHEQEVNGWYREDAFEMRIKLPKLGPFQPYQVVRGEWVEK
ncbi:MAG: hypothetical protein AAGI28_05335 [Pseudomonadota bacterium]